MDEPAAISDDDNLDDDLDNNSVSDEAIEKIQELINDLPDLAAITEDNKGDVYKLLADIDTAVKALTDDQKATLKSNACWTKRTEVAIRFWSQFYWDDENSAKVAGKYGTYKVSKTENYKTDDNEISYNIYFENGEPLYAEIGENKSNFTGDTLYIPNTITVDEKEIPVTRIGYWAFHSCQKLKAINLEEGSELVSIGAHAFQYCYNLGTINLENASTLVCIGYRAFEDCYKLGKITIPSSVRKLGDGAFKGCTIMEVCFAENSVLTKIGMYAFAYCQALEQITIPKGVTTLYSDVFSSCKNLNQVVAKGIDTIMDGSDSFRDELFADKDSFSAEFDRLPETQLNNLLALLNRTYSNGLSLKLPDLTKITYKDENGNTINIFQNMTKLQGIDISGVTELPADAFSGCENLTTVNISGVETIPENAFLNCGTAISGDGITVVGLNVDLSGVKTISGSAFSNSGLKSADLSSAEKIGDNAFSGCKQLGSVTLSDNLTSLGTGAFSGCTSLTAIDLPDTIKTIPESTFANSGLTDITLDYGVTEIGANAFNGCVSFSSITIPITVKKIGSGAFSGCNTLQTITCPCVFYKPAIFGVSGISDYNNGDDKFKNSAGVQGNFVKLHIWKWEQGDSYTKIVSTGCANGDYNIEENEQPIVTIYAPTKQGEVAILKSNQGADGKDLCNVSAELPPIKYHYYDKEKKQEGALYEGIPQKYIWYKASVTTPDKYEYEYATDEKDKDGNYIIDTKTIPLTSVEARVIFKLTDAGVEVEDEGSPSNQNDPGGGTTSSGIALPDFAIGKILTKIYGDPPFALTTVGLPDDAKETVTYKSSDPDILSIKGSKATILHSGTVTITATYPGDSKYESAYASVTIEIRPAQLIVIANDKTVVRGARMPAFTYYTNGLKNNDTFIGPTMTTTAKDTDTVGTYDINISGGAPSNASYIIRYQSGTLSVVEEEEKAETHNDDGKSGAGGNSGTGGNSHKGQTTRNKSKPSYSKSKAGNTASNKSKDSKSDTAQNSDGQKSIQSSFIPSERGIIIIDNLLFIFIIMLLFIVIFFRRKKKDNDED